MLQEKCIREHGIVGFMLSKVYLYEKLFERYKVNITCIADAKVY